jgi:uncharacterized protein
MTTAFAAHNLDTDAFARAQGQLSGAVPVTQFSRLMEELRVLGQVLGARWDELPPVQWQASGESRTAAGEAPESWLHLHASGSVPQICQRCLERVDAPLWVDYWFRFVADEATADAQDDEMEEDLLVTSRNFDLLALLEDELLMALPMVPVHDICPEPVKMAVADEGFAAAAAAKPKPFAALAGLKGRGKKAP